MITIGVDAHKHAHMAVALDERGRVTGQWQGENSAAGWDEATRWARALGNERRWGIEGSGGYGRGLAQHLVGLGEVVYDINPRLTATERRRSRRMDKSDAFDARAIAQVVQREENTLPCVAAEDETAALALLTSEREDAQAEATRLRNRLHHLLLQLDPEYHLHLPALTSVAGVRAAAVYTTTSGSLVQQERAAVVRRLAGRLLLAMEQVAELGGQIEALAQARYAPLTRLCGVSLLTVGSLAGILGPGRRFVSEAQLAAYAGVAPLETSSAGRVRHRLNRGGNRRLNAIVYRIALVQARCSPEAKAYLARRVAEGKTKREAFRALKRYLIRAIWRLWTECVALTVPPLARPQAPRPLLVSGGAVA